MEGNLLLFGMVVSALDMFDFVPKKEHPYLNKHFEEMCYDISPKLVKIKYEETTEVSASKGSDKATLSEKTFIPGTNKEQEYEYLDIKNYVNDVNRENSEVLAVQDQNGIEKEGYTYGLNRISAKIGKEDIIYNYSGRGDVSSIHAGDKKYSYSYDSYGNLLNEDGNAIGALHDKKKTGAFRNSFTYNGEQTDYSTNLQYLRNRYLDTSTGTFLTEDTYRGSLTELKSHNRYSYAENNPVNKIDPSGHKAKSVASKKAKSVVKATMAAAKKAISNVSSSNKASNQKASRSKSSSSTHKAKTTATKKTSHKTKKSGGGFSKKWNKVRKSFRKACTTAKKVKKEHPILVGLGVMAITGALFKATDAEANPCLSAISEGVFKGSVIGAGVGATFGFIQTLRHGGSLKDALNSAAHGFGSGAIYGAVSGGFGGFAGKVEGYIAKYAINTVGDAVGALADRELDGENVSTSDAVIAFGTSALFNVLLPIGFNKAKNTKVGQAAGKKISSVKNAAKNKGNRIASDIREKAGRKSSGVKENVGKNTTDISENSGSSVYKGESGTRPTWRQSEIDAKTDFPDYKEQISYMDGKEVPYGTKGSVRPDFYKAGNSVDIKNYNVETATGRSNLANNISKQYYQRVKHLPKGTKQSVLIDVRGQNVSNEELETLYNSIMEKTKNGIRVYFKTN